LPDNFCQRFDLQTEAVSQSCDKTDLAISDILIVSAKQFSASCCKHCQGQASNTQQLKALAGCLSFIMHGQAASAAVKLLFEETQKQRIKNKQNFLILSFE